MRSAALALVVAIACGQAATSAPTDRPASTTAHATVTHTPVPVNVDDMMGSVRSATVFAQVGDHIHAVTLLNHFVRYRIPVGARPHAVVSRDGDRVYVADRVDGRTRLRALDVRSGVELVTTTIADEVAGDGSLVMDRSDRLLLLLVAGTGVRVDAIDARSLGVTGSLSKAPCGERLLASESRIAVVCSNGTVGIDTFVGHTYVQVPDAPVIAAAMLPDGTIVLGTASGTIYRVPSGKTSLEAGPGCAPGSIVPGGIAAAAGPGHQSDDGDGFVVFSRSGETTLAAVHEPRAGARTAGPFAVSARGGQVLALWPFAYFRGDRGIWHVDLRSGLLERMVTLDDPVPLAVAPK